MFLRIHKAHVSSAVHSDPWTKVKNILFKGRRNQLQQVQQVNQVSSTVWCPCPPLPAAPAAMHPHPMAVQGEVRVRERLNLQEELCSMQALLCNVESCIHKKKEYQILPYLLLNPAAWVPWVADLRGGKMVCHHGIVNTTFQEHPGKNSCGERDRSLHKNICSKALYVHTHQILLFLINCLVN